MACILTFVAMTLLPITHGLASSLPNGCPASSKCPVPWMDTTIVALNLTECNPGDLVARHEGCCSCAYLDSENIPTIGIGYNLDNAGAKAAITNLGYNFSKVISGSQCLSQSAISSLWAGTLSVATGDAASVVASFANQCCGVQTVLVDMAFNLGRTKLSGFVNMIKYVNNEWWGIAAQEMQNSKWCGQVGSRCAEDMGLMENGCPCFAPSTAACDSQLKSCCDSEDVCCQGACCPDNSRCCPNIPDGCCGDDFPVCCGSSLSDAWCCPSGTTCADTKMHCSRFSQELLHGAPIAWVK